MGADFCNQITDVSCDYWDAYISTSKLCFPNARIILDRFHVTKLLNQPLDIYRKELRKTDKDNLNYKKLKWMAIQKWIDKLRQEGITVFDAFVKTLIQTKEYVANYVKDYLSNAVTEGLNNLIRSVRRTAFGMTNFEHLRLRVLAISN